MTSRCPTALFSVLLLLSNGFVVAAQSRAIPENLAFSIEQIQGERILKNTKILASNEFEGRAPGSRGEILTVDHIAKQFREAGAMPGNPNGTFFQKAPMIGYESKPLIALTANGKPIKISFMEDFVHDVPRLRSKVNIDISDVVFAGYGIVAPQYGWDDYKDTDVKNKLVVVLSGEPTRQDSADEKKSDAAFFRGVTRTYYSTRDSKYETAAKRGAAGILVITDPQKSETFTIFKTFAGMEGVALKSSSAAYQPAISGLVTKQAFDRLATAAGTTPDDLEKAAQDIGFKSLSLKVRGTISISSKLRQITSSNVIAKIEGSDPELKNEYVIYSAHWDHLGRDKNLVGDQIYNGANDNAVGIAQLIEIARGFAALKTKPKRSVLFMATTGEEKGFLGSRFYANNPLYPVSNTIAAINLDAGNPFGLTKDVGSAGYGNSTIDNTLAAAAEMQGRTFLKESLDGNGSYYFASDQIEFAKAGIPAVFPWSGFDYVGKPADFGERKWDEYGKDRYHRVGDEVMPDWDMTGAAQDARWLMIAGYLIADDVKRPVWSSGTEFKK
ncbi:MAG: M28 family peptidase [Pyrinomonadaceae bacterium]